MDFVGEPGSTDNRFWGRPSMFRNEWIEHFTTNQTTPSQESVLVGFVCEVERLTPKHEATTSGAVHVCPSARSRVPVACFS
jgi:hypothetical protein